MSGFAQSNDPVAPHGRCSVHNEPFELSSVFPELTFRQCPSCAKELADAAGTTAATTAAPPIITL